MTRRFIFVIMLLSVVECLGMGYVKEHKRRKIERIAEQAAHRVYDEREETKLADQTRELMERKRKAKDATLIVTSVFGTLGLGGAGLAIRKFLHGRNGTERA